LPDPLADADGSLGANGSEPPSADDGTRPAHSNRPTAAKRNGADAPGQLGLLGESVEAFEGRTADAGE
jgi:hypothetical protein